jgi:hypothetical protein
MSGKRLSISFLQRYLDAASSSSTSFWSIRVIRGGVGPLHFACRADAVQTRSKGLHTRGPTDTTRPMFWMTGPGWRSTLP